MGKNFISFYKTKFKKEWKIAFLSTIIIGLFVHCFKFTNYLPNHDSMYNFYSSQNVIGSGRWFLSIACGFSSFFDLPWINGLFSLVYIGLTSVIIISLFEVKNIVPVILISGLLVSFPAVTETFFFEFTADGYMLAMLLSALAVYIIKLDNKKIRNVIFSAILLCFSCGIYQAYISFAIVLMILYFIWKLLDNKDDKLITYSKWIRNQFVSVIVGLILFYIIWKFGMYFQNVEANNYQGINNLGLNINTIIDGFKSTIIAFINFFLEGNILKYGINLYGILNIIFFIFFISVIIYAIAKNKSKINISKIFLIILCLVCIPPVICIWNFVSVEVVYAPRMLQSIVLLFVFSVLLFDKYVKISLSNIYALFISVLIINFSIMANISYYYLDMEYSNSMVEAVEMKSEINKAISELDSNYELVIVGDRAVNVNLDRNSEAGKVWLFNCNIEKSLLYDAEHITQYFNNIMYYTPKTISYEKIEKNLNVAKIKQFDTWDDSQKVHILNKKYIILKLS